MSTEPRTCRAAVLHGTGQQWQIETLTVDPPVAGEVVVQWKVAGLCHSDLHLSDGYFDLGGGKLLVVRLVRPRVWVRTVATWVSVRAQYCSSKASKMAVALVMLALQSTV